MCCCSACVLFMCCCSACALCAVAVRVLCVLLQCVSFMRSNNTPSEVPCAQTHSAATHTDTATHSDCNKLLLQHTLQHTPSEVPCAQTHSAATHTDTTTHSDCNTLTLQHTLTATHSYYNTLCNTHLLERPARKRIPFVHLGFIDLTCFKAPC